MAAPGAATSDGVYDNERSGCTLLGYTYDKRNEAEPGCQGFTVQAGPADRPDFVRVGFDQTPEGIGPHSGSIEVGDPGASRADRSRRLVVVVFDTGWALVGPRTLTPEESETPNVERVSHPALTQTIDPANIPALPGRPADWTVYFWMDDNFTIFGEHHSISQANDPDRDAPVAQGPVSGGGIRADTHPDTGDPSANADPSDRRRPIRAAELRFGFCADGWCMSFQSQERTVYQGGAEGEQAAYDYKGLHAADCQFRDPGPNCREYYDSTGRMYVPAGLTIYQDPDSQSPTCPGPCQAAGLYPIPPTHIGSDGVLVSGVWLLDLRGEASPQTRPTAGAAPSSESPRRADADKITPARRATAPPTIIHSRASAPLRVGIIPSPRATARRTAYSGVSLSSSI
jgi:hypothetical protein